MTLARCLLALLTLTFAALAPAADDIVVADFEGKDYGTWKATGEAFGPGPARGTLPKQMTVDGFEGKGLVNTYFHGDGATGTLTSPPLKIERRYVNFLIGGGMHPGKACINLLVEGKVVRTATGPNDRPGGSEMLDWHAWDVGDLAGKEAVIEIVDRATGGWGHINIDQITQSNQQFTVPRAECVRELVLDKNYLNFPVKNHAVKVRMKVSAGEQVIDEFDIELAPGEPDFWVFLDVSRFQGKNARIEVNRLPRKHQGLGAIVPCNAIRGAENLYREKYRPQFHFSSRRGWNNDPNGMVYHDGEWHLYYQHNPYGWNWGNMHWGHAVSADLVHWKELPIAIYPHQYGDWVFSGSAVVDHANTSGFQQGDEKPIVAAYTSTGRGEAIAFSNDRGRTFTDFEGNPVVKHIGRDPKVIWYAPGKHWVMAVFDERDGSRGIAFYTSPDLKQWEFQSRIDGYYECPEVFELPVDGDRQKTRWVVYAADGEYAIGQFDGKTFAPEHAGKHKFNWGNCFYASQTFTNVPADDGRRIQIAWGRIGHPDMPFNQMMNFPVELTLRTTDEGIRMFAEPVKEIALLHAKKHAWKDVAVEPGGKNLLEGVTGDLFHIKVECTPGGAQRFGLNIRGVPIVCDVAKQELIGKNAAPLKPIDGRVRLEMLVDRTSIEVFGNDGRVYMPLGVIPADDNRTLEVFAEGGPVKVNALEVVELRSAWE